MKCPNCGGDEHRVLQTSQEDETVQRLRECGACRKRWHTAEVSMSVLERSREIAAAFQRMKEAIPGAE